MEQALREKTLGFSREETVVASTDSSWVRAVTKMGRKLVCYSWRKALGFWKRRRQVHSLLWYLGEYLPAIESRGDGKSAAHRRP
jgi:hypothetical protein